MPPALRQAPNPPTPGSWVIGVLPNNQSSVGGRSVAPIRQYFPRPALCQLQHAARLVSDVGADHDGEQAPGDNKWTVPLGGGGGRVFKLGDQSVNASLSGYYNVVRPDGAPNWQLRVSLALLFPAK